MGTAIFYSIVNYLCKAIKMVPEWFTTPFHANLGIVNNSLDANMILDENNQRRILEQLSEMHSKPNLL